jgi:hypothetical protein
MRRRNLAIVAVSLCICILLGFFVQQGGLSTLATALNVATTKVADLTEKKNVNATLGTEDNPFTILEIVPSREESEIGYLIPGCEPIDMEKAKYSQTAKDAFEANLSDVYDITVRTAYAFYDEIPSESAKPYVSVLTSELNDTEKTRTDVLYSDTYSEYGQWRKAPESNYSETGEYEYKGEGSGCFTYNSNDGAYTYVGEGQGSFIWVKSDYGSTTRYENDDLFLYTYIEYDHKDTFVSQVFGGKASEEFMTQVITLTPSELDHELDLIDSVDLISIHGATAEYSDLAACYFELNANGDAGNVRSNAPTFKDLGNDLTYDEVMDITERMASQNPAALLLDKSALIATTATEQELNCNKLLYMTLMYTPSTFWDTFSPYLESYTGNDGTKKVQYSKVSGDWSQNTFAKNPNTNASMAADVRCSKIEAAGSYIYTRIFAYNGDDMSMGSFLTGGKIKNSSFTSDAFVDDNEEAESLSNLDAMKFILQQAAATLKLRVLEVEGCDSFIYGSTGWEDYYQSLFPWYSPATSNEDGWLHDTDLIEVTTMPTWEFICSTGQYDYDGLDEYGNTKTLTTESSDDLLSKYDLIIFGAKQDASNGLNGYNKYDSCVDKTTVDLKNLIYVAVGGTIGTGTQRSFSGNTADAEAMSIRYSGNDITLKKLLECEDFLKAGKPIVFDSSLYSNGKPDTTKVDKSSKLYDLMTWSDKGSENRFVSNDIKSSKMKKLINNTCRLVFYEGGYPTEYNYISDNTKVTYNGSSAATLDGVIVNEIYQSKDTSGAGTLTYHFYIEGNATDTYNAYLNIDLNGDGVYSGSLKDKSEVDDMNTALGLKGSDKHEYDTSESAYGLTIYDKNMNKLGTTDPDNESKSYALSANTEYYATRTIASSQQGILPWKFEIQSRSNSSKRSSAVDYTAISNSENKKNVTVLQMCLAGNMSNDNRSLIRNSIWGTSYAMTAFTDQSIIVNSSDTYASFSARMTETADGAHRLPATTDTVLNNLYNGTQKLVVKKFETYLDPVQEFDVKIQFMFNNDWYKLFHTGNTAKGIENWEDFLSNYDMVVFGFVDSNSYTSDKTFQAGIQDFVDQGKSMILSHDTVSGSDLKKFSGAAARAGYTDNAVWLRTISGQRRAYYNKKSDGTYEKSYNEVKTNGVTISFISDYVKTNSNYSSLLGTYNPADYGESGSSYLVNEYPDNNIFLGVHYKGYVGSSLNIERVAKSGNLSGGWPTAAQTQFIKLTNNGQITTYPYKLNNVIRVLNSHVQNFQLDLDYEEGGDVNVWFNLSDQYDPDVAQYIKDTNQTGYSTSNYYSAKDQDGRNNFYIYNKGNITYTGSGHGSNNNGPNALMTDDEVKLFVNTIIAAYRQPESEPTVSIDDTDGTDGEGNNLLYLDYDGYTFSEDDDGLVGSVKNGADSRVETVDGKEMVAVYFSISDIGGNQLQNKKCNLTITQPDPNDSSKEVKADTGKIIIQKITTGDDGKEVRTTLTADSAGQYAVNATTGGTSYVLYFPYSEVRDDNNGYADYIFNTQSSYTKKNRNVTSNNSQTKVKVMLLPLFGLE